MQLATMTSSELYLIKKYILGAKNYLEFGMRCFMNDCTIAYIVGYENLFHHINHGVSNRSITKRNPNWAKYYRFIKTIFVYFYYNISKIFPFYIYKPGNSL